MEAAPPSYEKATLTDHWDIVARYVPSNDLCSAALVCSRWHSVFAPHLWGNPASHFGIENDRVYVALTRFKRTLRYARLLVRAMTHTLHLPPAHAEIYNGPHADWLRDILQRLPNLQALVVRGLPFFDHSALHALKYKPPKYEEYEPTPGTVELPASSGSAFQNTVQSIPSFGLRLLDASRCSNVTPSGLALALQRFETLMYLDLSFTYPAQDLSVLKGLRRLSGLQVLKLRGICLSDSGLEVLAESIGTKVRSLDLRDNRLSDRGVRTLLLNCFITTPQQQSNGRRSSSLLPYLGAEMLEIYQGEDFEGYLRKSFTGSFVSRLAIEDVPEGGLTHLYISGNGISAEGASGLVRSGRLHVLDLASVTQGFGGYHSGTRQRSPSPDVAFPGVEKLTPVLAQYASQDMTFLRIDHSLITQDVPNNHPEEVVHGRVELPDTATPAMHNGALELDSVPAQVEAVELPETMTPRYELPGDPMQSVAPPALHEPPRSPPPEEAPVATRRGSIFAPECVDSLPSETEKMSLLSPVSAMGETTLNGTGGSSPVSPGTPGASDQIPKRPEGRARSYSSVTSERKARLNAHTNGSHNLHPAMLPHLQTLILTDVPAYSPTKEAPERLIRFVKQCAEEMQLANAQARLDYSLPPGRKGHLSAIKHAAYKNFALRRIVLEIAPEEKPKTSTGGSRWRNVKNPMNEDRDVEALWSAAEADFSFFGEGEQATYPYLEYGRFADGLGSDQKEISVSSGSHPPQPQQQSHAEPDPKVDVISMLSTFRKNKKLAHQQKIDMGVRDSDTEGYWDGLMQVVRPAGDTRPDEEIDYYGNRYFKGWYYR